MNKLLDLVRRHKSGRAVGAFSVCSAHPMVLEATLRHSSASGEFALIEATSNQVNQDGGYTGMRPAAYRDLVLGLASSVDLPHDCVVLGGDHLGPNCWQHLPSAVAMAKAGDMVAEYVAAGFRKIHLDCSMSCSDDVRVLDDVLVAERSAVLCQRAEAAWRDIGGEPPVYIIGTEVPVPGGAHEQLDELAVTTPESARRTLDAHRAAFARAGLDAAWQRVIGLVVQPGVEFSNDRVIDYQPAKATALSQSIVPVPGIVFEAHSTDYQTPTALKQLVRDHFAILKVGPGVTFALREALWALSDIAQELGLTAENSLKTAVLDAMRRDASHWKAYYVEPDRLQFDLQFSLSDRVRYYWAKSEVTQACTRMLAQLATRIIPPSLISQYLPMQYRAIREGRLENNANALIYHHIARVLDDYAHACHPSAASERAAVA